MKLLSSPQPAGEILVERVRSRRFAERNGNYDQFFEEWNEYAAKRQLERAAKA